MYEDSIIIGIVTGNSCLIQQYEGLKKNGKIKSVSRHCSTSSRVLRTSERVFFSTNVPK